MANKEWCIAENKTKKTQIKWMLWTKYLTINWIEAYELKRQASFQPMRCTVYASVYDLNSCCIGSVFYVYMAYFVHSNRFEMRMYSFKRKTCDRSDLLNEFRRKKFPILYWITDKKNIIPLLLNATKSKVQFQLVEHFCFFFFFLLFFSFLCTHVAKNVDCLVYGDLSKVER